MKYAQEILTSMKSLFKIVMTHTKNLVYLNSPGPWEFPVLNVALKARLTEQCKCTRCRTKRCLNLPSSKVSNSQNPSSQWDISLKLPKMLVASCIFILNWKQDVVCVNRCWLFSPCSFTSTDFVKKCLETLQWKKHFQNLSCCFCLGTSLSKMEFKNPKVQLFFWKAKISRRHCQHHMSFSSFFF